jgi:hypothetical protein
MRRQILICLAVIGTSLVLGGCAGPCGFVWDDWFNQPKTCHQQRIGPS